MKTVFLLQHVHEFEDGHEDIKLIGIFSTKLMAEEVLAKVEMQPGFAEHPQGFEISEHTIDRASWLEGFSIYTYPVA